MKYGKKHNKNNSLTDINFLSEKITDNSESISDILNDTPYYLKQFDLQTVDSKGASAPNDIYDSQDQVKIAELERNIAFQEGWTYLDKNKTYNVVPESEFKHSNMIPNYKKRGHYGTNDIQNVNMMNYKNELFTGKFGNWKNKREREPLFKPMKHLTNPYGTPIMDDSIKDRYETSRYRNGETIIKSSKVTPGLNLKPNQDGTHGYHDMYRVKPKNIDELRTLNKQKISYKGRVIHGMGEEKGPLQSPVMSYKPPTFVKNDINSLLPTSDINKAPKAKDNFILKDTNRIDQHCEYTGSASNESLGRNVPEYMREKYKYSTKQNFTLPEPMQKNSKSEIKYNTNLDSYQLNNTNRSETSDNNYLGNATDNTNIYINSMYAKPNLRETIGAYPTFNVKSNTMRGTVEPLDIANPTIREISVENKLNPYVSSDMKQRIYFSDNARTTLKEDFKNLEPSNTFQKNNTHASFTDVAKTTLKENTVESNPPIQFQSNEYHGIAFNGTLLNTTTKEANLHTFSHPLVNPNINQVTCQYQDSQKNTLKETSVSIPYQTMLRDNQSTYANNQDIPRNTIKEINTPTPIRLSQNQITYTNIQDIPRNTLKEIVKPSQNSIQLNQQIYSNLQDTPKNTIKEILHPQRSHFSQNQYMYANLQDIPKNTIRETIDKPYQNNIKQEQYSYANFQDIPKNTIKELSVENRKQNNLSQKNNIYSSYQDTAKNTIKETTIQIPYKNYTSVTKNIYTEYQDIPKNTIKESTINIPYNTYLTAENKQYTPLSDISRNTIRETLRNPQNTNIFSIQRTYADMQDSMKSTLKETTTDIPYQTNLNSIQNGTYTESQDIAKNTIKEQIHNIPSQQFIKSGNGQYSNLQDIAKNTIKEELINIPYQTILSSTKSSYANSQDIAKNTLKENIANVPTNMYVKSINNGAASTFNHEPLKTTIKESTIKIPYHSYIKSDSNKGSVDTFNNTPLRQTMKETNIDNKHIGIPLKDINKGYGYLSSKMEAPNTNSQFTVTKNYIKPLLGNEKPKCYDDAYNTNLNETKEKLQFYYEPVPSNVTKGPDQNNINIRCKDDDNRNRTLINGISNENQTRIMPKVTLIKDLKEIMNIDPDILTQLQTNDYAIKIN